MRGRGRGGGMRGRGGGMELNGMKNGREVSMQCNYQPLSTLN